MERELTLAERDFINLASKGIKKEGYAASHSMKPEVKDPWIKDLRSGVFLQTRGALHRHADDRDSFCCLGLLSKRGAEAGHCKVDKVNSPFGLTVLVNYDLRTGLPPKSILDWSGLPDEVGSIYGPQGDICLSGLNDNGATFSEIADVVELYF